MKDLSIYDKKNRREGEGQYGHFIFELRSRTYAIVIAAGGEHPEEDGWEHVSVHVRYVNKKKRQTIRTPSWEEMSEIKKLFFEDDECVFQLHHPSDDHINDHNHVLHLWRNQTKEMPMPPKIMV